MGGATSMNDQVMSPGPWLQVEISAACQAGCIDCVRWVPQGGMQNWQPGTIVPHHLNGHVPHINTFYDIDNWNDHIKMFRTLKHVNLCGNMGDPMTHPNIVQVCESTQLHHPGVAISINTNGGIGSVHHYRQLAAMGVTVIFGIDGLKDTNHIYRRAVNWTRLQERVLAFIGSGGRAHWQWIDFPHTQHQLEQARLLSEELGFEKFVVQSRWSPESEIDQAIVDHHTQAVDLKTKHTEVEPTGEEMEQQHLDYIGHMIDSGTKIHPQCANTDNDLSSYHPEINLTADGRLWPCCFMSDIEYHKLSHVRHWWKKHTKGMPDNWNSLYHHTPDQIINSEWWQNVLPSSWDTSNPVNTNPICMSVCGACNESTFARR